MVNEYSIAFANSVVGQVNDERGGQQTAGQLTVTALEFVGLFVWAPLNEMVNTAPLTGLTLTNQMEVEAVVGRAGEANANATESASCALFDDEEVSVMQVSSSSSSSSSGNCAITLTPAQTRGSNGVPVVVTFVVEDINSGQEVELKAEGTFRVWFPVALSVQVSDSDLGLVLPAHGAGDPSLGHGADMEAVLQAYVGGGGSCGGQPRYQQTRLSAVAKFSTEVEEAVVDVSHLVAFASSNYSVAEVAVVVNNASSSSSTSTSASNTVSFLRGLTPGLTNVSLARPSKGSNPGIAFVLQQGQESGSSASTLSTVATVQVSGEEQAAYVEKLTVVVHSGVSWRPLEAPVARGEVAVPTLQLVQELTAAGQTAHALVYAHFDGKDVENRSFSFPLL
jgi:hypothetical protein